MSACADYEQCPFIKKYEPDFDKSETLKKIYDDYCNGNLQNTCIRKKIERALGGTEYVPVNMTPQGKPVAGTTMNEWSAEVLSLLEKYR